MSKILKDQEITGSYELYDTKAIPGKMVATNIIAFIPPGKTIEERINFQTSSGPVDSFLVTKAKTILHPDRSDIDRKNVSALIQNNNVRIGGMPSEEHQKLVKEGLKKSTPRFIIKSLDKVSMTKFNRERTLIKARNVLYNDNPEIEKKKLIWLCSYFGIPYRNNINDVKRYKQDLILRLDRFVQKSTENVERFLTTFNKIKEIEIHYYINELMRLNVVSFYNGIYKFEGRPIGSTLEDIISFLESDPTLYESMKTKVFNDNKGTVYS